VGPAAVPPSATVRPDYGGASLTEVLPGVLAALAVPGAVDPLGLATRLEGVRRVAVLLVDGLGYELLPRAAPVAPVLVDAAAGRLGDLRAITATFPSTTPVGLASLSTGAPPGAHGLVGFTVRIPGSDRVLNHIEWDDDPDPRGWQPVTTLFLQAAAAGVDVSVASRTEFAGSGLTCAAYRGARYLPADDADTLAATMLTELRQAVGPCLVYGYHPDLDRAGHLFGVDSDQWCTAAVVVDRLLGRLVAGLPADSALVVTADHGQLDVPASHRFDIDSDPRLAAGVEVVAGEPRVRFLHTTPGASGDVIAAWREVVGDAAWVVSRREVVAAGWFGPVAAAHLPRIGDVVVVCQDRYAVMATGHEPDRVSNLVAFHGSWTSAEMRVPLLVVRS
jgi:hypothetical protein